MQSVPENPFLVLQFTNSRAIGHSSYVDENFEYTSVLKEFNLVIDFFGKKSLTLAEKFNTLLYSSSFLRALKELKIGIVKVQPITDISAIAGAGFEERANMVLVLSYIYTVKNYLTNITQVELEEITKWA